VARGVKAVGYDYPPDFPIRHLVTGERRAVAPEEWATHHTFFPAGIGVIEYLVNLDRLGRDRVRFLALPLRLEGGDGAPARAIALLD
jgi:kynurenine formamidase